MDREFCVLIVDDDEGLSANLRDVLEARGYRVLVASEGRTAVTVCQEEEVDLTLVDIRLPDMSGMQLIERLAEASPATEQIIITAHASLESAAEATSHSSVVSYQLKPLDLDALLPLIDQVKERRQAEESLREREQLYRLLAENVTDVIWTADMNRRLTYVSPSVARLRGYGVEETLSQALEEIVTPSSVEALDRLFEGGLATADRGRGLRRVWTVELEVIRRDGSTVWTETKVALLLGPERRLAGFVGTTRDITERKRAEQATLTALEESRRREAEVSGLLEATRAVLHHREFVDAARIIFDACKRLIGAATGYVALMNNDDTETQVLLLDTRGPPRRANRSMPMPIRGPRAEAYRSGKAVYENDFANTEWAKQLPKGHAVLENVLFAPLAVGGEIAGLLALANKPGGFTTEDARLAEAFGELAAVALQNSRTLESLEDAERRFRSVVETAADAVISADGHGDIIFWNRAAEAMFGYSADEMAGKPITAIMPERFREPHRQGLDWFALAEEKRVIGGTVELVGLRRDGSEFPIELSLANWEARGEVFITAIVRDISERKQAEELFRVMAESSPIGVYVAQGGRLRYVNTRFQEIVGRSEEELLDVEALSLVAPEDQATVRDSAIEMLKGERFAPYEFRVATKSGEPRWALEHVAPIVYEGRRATLGNVVDVTQRVQAERALRRSEASLAEAQRMAHFGSWDWDVTSDELRWSDETYRIFGLSRREFGGTYESWFRFVHPDDSERVRRIFDAAMSEGGTIDFDYRIVLPDGSERVVHAQGEVTFDEVGRPTRVVGTVHDITERVRTQEELRQALARLQGTLEGTIQAMATILETRDPYTAGHQRRVTDLAVTLARETGLPADRIDGIRVAATVHDIGKISVPTEMLNKPGRLTDMEMEIIRTHCQVGYDILRPISFPWPVADIVLQHHERMDGSGYPAGLTGEQILLEARILAVADVVEAMSSHRPYRPALGVEAAVEEVSRQRGVLYDETVVDVLLRLAAKGQLGLE